jgi:hypothetical protein
MINERHNISWGIRFLNSKLPRPEVGGMLLIEGSKKSTRYLTRYMICEELVKGRPVHWIDGGMGLDPSTLIRPLARKKRGIELLDNLHVCRGFTAHQMAEIVKRLASESPNNENLVKGRLIIISDLASMFADTQVKRAEGHAMLKESLSNIQVIAKTWNSLVLVTVNYQAKPFLTKSMKSELKNAAIDRLTILSQSKSKITAKLHSIDMIAQPLVKRNPQISLQDFNVPDHISKVVWTDPPEANSSSDIPNGDNSAEAARKASAS